MSAEEIIIRNAEPQDFESIYEFLCALEDTVLPKAILRQLYLRNISDPDNHYLVATHNGEVCGYLSCHGQYLLHHGGFVGEIQELYVIEAKRGMGVGKRLIRAIRKLAKETNMLQLEVTSNTIRTSSHEFYLREGFEFTHKKFVSILHPS